MGTDGISASQILMGHQLALPGLAFSEEPTEFSTAQARDMLRFFRECPPREFTKPPNRPTYRNPHLESATHVFLRYGQRRSSLKTRYAGPFPLISITEKSAIISKNGYLHKVSRDRIKMAHLMPIRFLDEKLLLENLSPIDLGEPVQDDPEEDMQDSRKEGNEGMEVFPNKLAIQDDRTLVNDECLVDYYKETLPFQESSIPDIDEESACAGLSPTVSENNHLLIDPGPSTSEDNSNTTSNRPTRKTRLPFCFDSYVYY